ncbi:MAG TPA: hypothetical protein VFT12_13685 [Thermoanaerobaculia bacterium]|nr:hypothetical protein [Thermoanaerobaculia bacterium]
MLSKMTSRARTAAAICLLLASCQSTIDRSVSARAERRETNLAFTIENNLLRLTTATVDGREGRFFLGTAQPRSVVQPAFAPEQPRRLTLTISSRDSFEVEPIYMNLGVVGDAIIGFDAWEDRAVTIDYVAGMVTVHKTPIETAGMALFRFQDEPAIALLANGRRVPAAIDTAIPDSLILPRGTSPAGRASMRIEIAGIDFGMVDVALADVSRARIGNRLLSKFLVSIDYGSRQAGLWRDPRVELGTTRP